MFFFYIYFCSVTNVKNLTNFKTLNFETFLNLETRLVLAAGSKNIKQKNNRATLTVAL